MKKRQWLAWTMTLTLTASLALSALAAPGEMEGMVQPSVETQAADGEGTGVEAVGTAGTKAESDGSAEAEEELSQAGPDDGGVREPDAIDQPVTEEAQRAAEKLEKLVKDVTTEPESVESVSFGDVEVLMRSNNLQIRSFQETADYLGSLNYEKLSDTLRKQLNQTAEAQFGLIQLASYTHSSVDGYAYGQLDQLYGVLRTQFDDIKEGKTQESTAGAIRQLRYYQDQLVMGGETMYVALSGLEIQRAGLKRQLDALDRTVEEMELRNRLGQISDLQVREVTSGRAKLVSGMETMDMNIRTMKYQLENMLGAGITGTIALGGVPAVTEKQLAAMDEEKDLAAARSASYDLYSAAKTLETAQDTYRDDARGTGYSENNSTYRKALSDWKTAQNTYNASVRSFELKFRTLYRQVKDYYQVWKNAQTALEDKQVSYEVAAVKQQQGNLSRNALLAAQDEVKAAEDAVTRAAGDLFSSYNTYCWAVKSGILN